MTPTCLLALWLLFTGLLCSCQEALLQLCPCLCALLHLLRRHAVWQSLSPGQVRRGSQAGALILCVTRLALPLGCFPRFLSSNC